MPGISTSDEETATRQTHELVGIVETVENNRAYVALRNNLTVGDEILFLSRKGVFEPTIITELLSETGENIQSGRNEETVIINIPPGICANDLIRRKSNRAE